MFSGFGQYRTHGSFLSRGKWAWWASKPGRPCALQPLTRLKGSAWCPRSVHGGQRYKNLFRPVLDLHPEATHWLHFSVEHQGLRMTVTEIDDVSGHCIAWIAKDEDVERLGLNIARRLELQGTAATILKGIRVDEERVEDYHPVVCAAVKGLSEGGCEFLVDVDVYCRIHMVGPVSRRRLESKLFRPMLPYRGVKIMNLQSAVPDNQA